MCSTQATYEEVMLDWAVAELLSPTWTDYWSGPECDWLRGKITEHGTGSLSGDERAYLIHRVKSIRRYVIQQHGPQPSWSFTLKKFAREAFGQFDTLHATRLFRDMPELTEGHPESDLVMRSKVVEMIAAARRGEQSRGTPIAVLVCPDGRPRLIEGYKRLITAYLMEVSVPQAIFVCAPP